MIDGCNDRRLRTRPGQFFVFARILRASLWLWVWLCLQVRVWLWAGELRSFHADCACQLGDRLTVKAHSLFPGLWDLYKALPQDNVVSCKPKHNM